MSEEVLRANWNYVYEKGFLDILNEHKVQDRFTTQYGWTMEAWNSIHRKFNEMFPLARFTKAHLQEKNKELKCTYRAIRDARKDSGADLDSATGLIMGGPNVWKMIEKNHKKVLKFRKKGFLHYNSCEMLYGGSIALGDPVHPPTENLEPEHREAARVGQEESEAQAAPRHTVAATVGVVAAAASSTSAGAQEPSETQSAPSGASTQEHGSGKKRKQNQVFAVLDEYLEYRKKQSEKKVEALLEKRSRAEEFSVEKCLDTTNAIEELTDEEKAIASEVFENDINREIFMKQKDLNVRLIWLRRKIRRLALLEMHSELSVKLFNRA